MSIISMPQSATRSAGATAPLPLPNRRIGNTEAALGMALPLAALCATAACLIQMIAPHPWAGLGLVCDRLSAATALLVTGVGAATYRFSRRALDGEPGHAGFLRCLAATVGAATVLMLASHLILLFFAWLAVSLGLHRLLVFYADRPQAHRPARKKFLISRLGDAALLGAIGVFGLHFGVWDTQGVAALAATHGGDPALHLAVFLIAAAALTKSAQFPFHSWLPETLEAPTPVSALMHAGIINAGGALLLRFALALAHVPEAQILLALAGTATLCVALPAMWAQPTVKKTLAWSTVGQMGFMMAECAAGAFALAAVHLIGHGFYKARTFLMSGEIAPPVQPRPLSPGAALALLAAGTVFGLIGVALTAPVTGLAPLAAPGTAALAWIVALSVGQVWIAAFQSLSPARASLAALMASLALPLAAGTLAHGAETYLAPVLGAPSLAHGPLAGMAALPPAVAITALAVLHPLLPVLSGTRGGRAFLVHSLHGFYVGAFADRVVDAVQKGTRQ